MRKPSEEEFRAECCISRFVGHFANAEIQARRVPFKANIMEVTIRVKCTKQKLDRLESAVFTALSTMQDCENAEVIIYWTEKTEPRRRAVIIDAETGLDISEKGQRIPTIRRGPDED